MDDLDEIAVEHVVCPRCEAKLGERCRTIGGTTTETHTTRFIALQSAYALGYQAGLADR